VADKYLDLLDAHRQTVANRLADASAQARAAFAASCAEELYPLYPAFAEEESGGDPDLVRSALDAVWQWAETGADEGIDPAQLADRVADAAPRSDESRSKLAPWAQNAALATAAALDAWAGEGVDRVGAASERVIEAIDYVRPSGDEPPSRLDVVGAELTRQLRALEQMANTDNVPAVREEAVRGQAAGFVLDALGRGAGRAPKPPSLPSP
jgi:hypothetical protein